MPDLNALIQANARRWTAMRLTDERVAVFSSVARRLVASKPRYAVVARDTGVPWFVIAVIHEREASQRFDRYLGNGQLLSRETTEVPAGRGPFIGPEAFENGCVDALVACAPYAAQWRDWSIGGALTLLERYNGLGYATHGQPSPYIWSGSDQYSIGKITRDHGPIEP